MKFDSEVFMAAVLGIFRSRKIVAAGSGMPLQVLREEWSEVGLRNGDLAAGIEALLRSGVVIADSSGRGLWFTLTPNGEDQIRLRHGGMRDHVEAINTCLALHRLRRRRRAASGPAALRPGGSHTERRY